MGTNNYPRSIDETMNVLNTFAKTNKNYNRKIFGLKTDNTTEVAFSQKEINEINC